MALGYKSLIKIRCVSHFHVPQSCMSWAQSKETTFTYCIFQSVRLSKRNLSLVGR